VRLELNVEITSAGGEMEIKFETEKLLEGDEYFTIRVNGVTVCKLILYIDVI
jgi:hypothetical protein